MRNWIEIIKHESKTWIFFFGLIKLTLIPLIDVRAAKEPWGFQKTIGFQCELLGTRSNPPIEACKKAIDAVAEERRSHGFSTDFFWGSWGFVGHWTMQSRHSFLWMTYNLHCMIILIYNISVGISSFDVEDKYHKNTLKIWSERQSCFFFSTIAHRFAPNTKSNDCCHWRRSMPRIEFWIRMASSSACQKTFEDNNSCWDISAKLYFV